ncbi:hypothetical protein PAP_06150 [Palaeococcus pacificus DY20341]|uniref:Uncharacterized protein n=1 Tax=Palaeococcus pacificus DY20341 TaxID=1343739 RepID=A0A075LSB6_9EURY|nr:competence protein CoiA family protein [Palaeococcus pacificus]AIF69630.1 hypothetical protein PAP_06150 [Palaeococcus pacificus DY20341]
MAKDRAINVTIWKDIYGAPLLIGGKDMWRALDTKTGERITASEAARKVGESYEARHQAYVEKRFVCPACKMEVSLRKSKSGRWYFSHVPTKNGCEYYYWSEKEEWAEELHDEFKLWLKERLSIQRIKVEAEEIMDFNKYKLIPDLYFETGGRKVAVEVVVSSPRTKEEILEKSRRYAEQDIYVLWIFYWKFKRSDGVTVTDLARASLNEQKVNKRMFRKDSLFRLIHALNRGIILFFEDEPTISGDPYSVVAMHLLWDDNSGSLLGLMPWVLNYKQPLELSFKFKDLKKVKRWPDGKVINGPFKIALVSNAYPQKHVAILGYYFEKRGYRIRLGISIGSGIAHRFYLRKGKKYWWGVIPLYWKRYGKSWKWIISVSDSWPEEKLLTRKDLYRMFYLVLDNLKRKLRDNVPSEILNQPLLAWNHKLGVGYFLGITFSEFWEHKYPKMVFIEEDLLFLKSIGALKFENIEKIENSQSKKSKQRKSLKISKKT